MLGGVFLCVTGAEALYADMGHFGARPIRVAWSALVFPSLVLNYAGQAKKASPEGAPTSDNIFFPAVSGVVDDADGFAGDGRHGHRQPVDHHRRFLDDTSGDPAWLDAASAHHADIRRGLRPDLCRSGQLAADAGHDGQAGDPVPPSDNLASAYGIAVSATMLAVR